MFASGERFGPWLQAEMQAQKISQRQLAGLSGVDHSTISRLVTRDRSPSLATAIKLTEGLRRSRIDTDAPLSDVASAEAAMASNRIEEALRADTVLSEARVRRIMEFYHAVRRGSLAENLEAALLSSPGAEPGRSTNEGGSAGRRSEPTT